MLPMCFIPNLLTFAHLETGSPWWPRELLCRRDLHKSSQVYHWARQYLCHCWVTTHCVCEPHFVSPFVFWWDYLNHRPCGIEFGDLLPGMKVSFCTQISQVLSLKQRAEGHWHSGRLGSSFSLCWCGWGSVLIRRDGSGCIRAFVNILFIFLFSNTESTGTLAFSWNFHLCFLNSWFSASHVLDYMNHKEIPGFSSLCSILSSK